MHSMPKIDTYLEIGKKRIFAGAIDWPGWSRSGRNEEAALQALFEYGPRYARVLDKGGLGFVAPAGVSALVVVERVPGDATTDFGAPGTIPAADTRPIDDGELRRLQMLLEALWRAFDAVVAAATGQELHRGPRGGGRELEGIVRHVLGAETGYLRQLGWKFKKQESGELVDELQRTRQGIREGLVAAVHGDLPTHGPRGGAYWPARYFVRRVAWHVLDHTWEIEDRLIPL